MKAIIFDRDGVLAWFDFEAAARHFEQLLPITIGELATRWKQWGEKVGFPSTLAEEEAFFSGFWDSLCAELVLDDCQELHQSDYTSFMAAYPEAHRALEICKERGLRVGVLSNFELASLERSLKAIGVWELVDVALSSTMIGARKPHPDAYREMAHRLGVELWESLLIDDEWENVEGARQVGMPALHLQRGGKGNMSSLLELEKSLGKFSE